MLELLPEPVQVVAAWMWFGLMIIAWSAFSVYLYRAWRDRRDPDKSAWDTS